jgi:hypothetical protein
MVNTIVGLVECVSCLSDPFAGGIGGAAPKLVAGIAAASGDALHHWLAAQRTSGRGHLILRGLNESEQFRSINQTDGFAGGKIQRDAREFPRRDDDGFVGVFGGHQAEYADEKPRQLIIQTASMA